ncbi:MAG: cation-translocating P-type ATPase [Merdibacter sp.]
MEKEEEMIFAGLITFVDPPRPEAASSIAAHGRRHQGVMITGDHPLTAFAIARQLNIAQHEDQVMSGSELDALDDEQLQRRLGDIRVFARVTPAHKVRIVEAFRREGDVVSMSGDGVNDAPSLKKADIGIAMGKNGSDVCRQASDMILTDDRFATIVDAVSEGRHLYMNIQKAVIYLLSCNLGEIMSLFLAVICLPAVGAPLRAVQILWINLVTDAFPALALGVDPKESDVMRQPPRPRSESLFAHGRMSYTVLNGMFIGTMTLVAFRWGLQRDLAHAQSMAFMVLSMSQLFHALNLRSLEHSLFRAGPFKNGSSTVLFGIVLQVIVCELPAAQLLPGPHLDGMSWAVVFVCFQPQSSRSTNSPNCFIPRADVIIWQR